MTLADAATSATPPAEPPAMPATPALVLPPGMIESSVILRIESCLECGAVFGIGAELLMQRINEKGKICCPNGHAFDAARIEPSGSDLVGTVARLVNALRNSQRERDRLATLLSRMPRQDAGPISDEEFERRLRWLMNHAERLQNTGRIVCRFCQATRKQPRDIKSHFKASHRADVAAMPAEVFA